MKMVSLMTLKFTVVLMSLSLYVAQPILNNNKNDASQEEEVVTEISRSKASSSSLIQLVVDNDEARKKWFYQREQSLHFALNGANGHYLKAKDNDESGDASAIPAQDAAPVATPEQLRALLKKRTGTESTENKRVVRQVPHPGFQVAPTVGGYPSPYNYQPQPYAYTSPPPPPTSAPVVITEAAHIASTEAPVPISTVATDIQSARDEYRKRRFKGSESIYALALKLSKAGNTPLSGGGSYSG